MSDVIPPFIQKVAAAISVDGEVHIEESHRETLDYLVYLEPNLRMSWGIGDPEKYRERGRLTGEHRLVFRHFQDIGDAWMCFVQELRQVYAQSMWDEDDEDRQAPSPEAAFAEMLTNLVEEIDLLTATRDSLRGLT